MDDKGFRPAENASMRIEKSFKKAAAIGPQQASVSVSTKILIPY